MIFFNEIDSEYFPAPNTLTNTLLDCVIRVSKECAVMAFPNFPTTLKAARCRRLAPQQTCADFWRYTQGQRYVGCTLDRQTV